MITNAFFVDAARYAIVETAIARTIAGSVITLAVGIFARCDIAACALNAKDVASSAGAVARRVATDSINAVSSGARGVGDAGRTVILLRHAHSSATVEVRCAVIVGQAGGGTHRIIA